MNSLSIASSLMMEGVSKAEKITDMVSKVWNNAIYEKFDSETDRFTRKLSEKDKRELEDDKNRAISLYYVLKEGGHTEEEIINIYSSFVDFNSALLNYALDPLTIHEKEEIAYNQERVTAIMRKLQNPPAIHRDAYNALNDLYDAYARLTDMAVNPSGSLQTFNSAKDGTISNFKSAYRKLETRMP
jgi:hypothetical protein